jgi:hypothetical protein
LQLGENKMATAIEQNTPDVLAEVLSGAKHIDALEVLQEDITFLQGLSATFGSKPTKEENVVLAKYQSVLDYKTEFLGQLLQAADMNFSSERSTFNHYELMKKTHNITVIITEKEEA